MTAGWVSFSARTFVFRALVMVGLGVVFVTSPISAQSRSAVVDIESVPPTTGSQPIFDITRFLDLHFGVLLDDGLSGDHLLTIEVKTPAGHLYQRLEIPLTTEPESGTRTRRLTGFPLPVQVQQSARVETDGLSRWLIEADLAVAGTSIVNSSIYGRWSLDLALDGQAIDCEGECTYWLYAPPGLSVFRDGFESGTTQAWDH